MTVRDFNQERKTRGEEALIFQGASVLCERATTWEGIYLHFNITRKYGLPTPPFNSAWGDSGSTQATDLHAIQEQEDRADKGAGAKAGVRSRTADGGNEGSPAETSSNNGAYN